MTQEEFIRRLRARIVYLRKSQMMLPGFGANLRTEKRTVRRKSGKTHQQTFHVGEKEAPKAKPAPKGGKDYPIAHVSSFTADAFGMRGMPNVKVKGEKETPKPSAKPAKKDVAAEDIRYNKNTRTGDWEEVKPGDDYHDISMTRKQMEYAKKSTKDSLSSTIRDHGAGNVDHTQLKAHPDVAKKHGIDTITVAGKTYHLEGQPPRWHGVSEDAKQASSRPSQAKKPTLQDVESALEFPHLGTRYKYDRTGIVGRYPGTLDHPEWASVLPWGNHPKNERGEQKTVNGVTVYKPNMVADPNYENWMKLGGEPKPKPAEAKKPGAPEGGEEKESWATASKKLKWVDMGRGRHRVMYDGMAYGNIENTAITQDRKNAFDKWMTSDEKLHETRGQAKKHELETETRRRLMDDGYVEKDAHASAPSTKKALMLKGLASMILHYGDLRRKKRAERY